MKKCPECGKSVPDTDLFCADCGYKFDKKTIPENSFKKCVECGNDLLQGDLYCPFCGRSIYENDNYKDIGAIDEPVVKQVVQVEITGRILAIVFAIMVLILVVVGVENNTSHSGGSISNAVSNNVKEEYSMPSLAGMDKDEAASYLSELGIYNYSFTYESSNKYNSNTVTRTSPSANSTINKETGITIYVSNSTLPGDGNTYPLYQIEISGSVGSINIRSYPSLDSKMMGSAYPYEIYNVYESAQKDGYQWYRISSDLWVASNGSWINRASGVTSIYSCETKTITVNDDEIGVYDKPKSNRTQSKDIYYGETYNVYNSFSDGSYVWYELGKGQWIKEPMNEHRVSVR